MSNYSGLTYTVDISFQDIDSGGSLPLSYNFAMEDSIYSFFPKATLFFADNTALFRESLATVAGIKFAFKYGLGTNYLVNNYKVIDDSVVEQISPLYYGGSLKIEMVHSLYNDQESIYKKWDDRISSVIRSIANNNNFSKATIK